MGVSPHWSAETMNGTAVTLSKNMYALQVWARQ